MEYQYLYHEFLRRVPGDAAMLNGVAEEISVGDADSMHVIFGLVVDPYIEQLVRERNAEKLQPVFGFLEEMASAEDWQITEVLEFTILEDLAALDQSDLEYCREHMGRATLEYCQNVEQSLM